MMRYARIAMVWVVGMLCAGAASAQTAPAAASDFDGYAEVNVGATLGHTSDKSVGVEAGYHVFTNLDVFVEGGHIGNAATSDFDARGRSIANAVGGSVSAVQKVNYFDVGVRYHVPYQLTAAPSMHPYVALGVGVAHVTSETVFSVNGSTIDPAALGIQLGTDLSGSLNKTFVTIGFGADFNFAQRYFVDVSYRYGHVAAKTSEIENDVAIHTNRVQAGVGIRF